MFDTEILIIAILISGASITIPGTNSNDEMGIGMVEDGTKCGEGKVTSFLNQSSEDSSLT